MRTKLKPFLLGMIAISGLLACKKTGLEKKTLILTEKKVIPITQQINEAGNVTICNNSQGY